MKIYKYEKELGLEDKILNASTSIILDVFDTHQNPKIDHAVAAIIADKPPTNDLMSVAAILVSTSWNLNDDIFTPRETWAARFTPYMKPVNKGHLGREAVNMNLTFGVISNTSILDRNLDPVNTFHSDDGPPEFFHIMVNIYLWERYFPSLTNEVKSKIEKGTMFVSMECIFESFDYGLKSSNNEVMIVQRDDSSSWMSRHLRAYGGTGEIEINGQKYKIGRVLKEINFSGLGFVDKPANKDSLVFKDYISFGSEGENNNISFSELKDNSVLFFRKGEKYLWQIK